MTVKETYRVCDRCGKKVLIITETEKAGTTTADYDKTDTDDCSILTIDGSGVACKYDLCDKCVGRIIDEIMNNVRVTIIP